MAMSILSPHKSWDDASSGRSQEVMGDMSPSRPMSSGMVEFDNPTPTRRKMSSRKQSSFDTITERQQRESIMILDEVCMYVCVYVCVYVWCVFGGCGVCVCMSVAAGEHHDPR